MHNFHFPEKHPILWTCLCIGVVSLPQWLSGTWALFSDEPLAKVMARNLDMMEIPFSPNWVTVPLALAMFGYLAYALRNRPVEPSQRAAVPTATTSEQAKSAEQKRGPEDFQGAQRQIMNRLNNDDTQKKRMALLELREEGVALHQQRLFNPSEYDPWVQRFEDWHRRILEAAEALDPELRAMLSPLGELPAWNRGWAINADHRLAQNMIWETHQRLERYLDQTR